MLDVIRFVRGAVSDKDLSQVLTHFCIYGNRIQGSNGRLFIDAECDGLDLKAVVHAERFLRAVDACDSEPKIKITDKGRMSITGKGFKAHLSTLDFDTYPLGVQSKGAKVPCGEILPALRALRKFIGNDAEASRIWASAILFSAKDGQAISTNNATIAMVKAKPFKDDVILPFFAADELLRIGVEPKHYVTDTESITFFWEGSWMRTQKFAVEWPIETARKWLGTKAKMVPLPKGLAASVTKLTPFCADPALPLILFAPNKVSTVDGLHQAELQQKDFDPGEGAFRADNLLPILAQADAMGCVERAAVFTGPNGFKAVLAKVVT